MICGIQGVLECWKQVHPFQLSLQSWGGVRQRQYAWRKGMDTSVMPLEGKRSKNSRTPLRFFQRGYKIGYSHRLGKIQMCSKCQKIMAPQVGFEPTTLRLTAECSAIELLRSVVDTPERFASEF